MGVGASAYFHGDSILSSRTLLVKPQKFEASLWKTVTLKLSCTETHDMSVMFAHIVNAHPNM